MGNETEKLRLIVTASFVGAIGYGYVYKCHVSKILSGILDEREISLTLLAGDQANLDFISTRLDSVELEMGLNKKGTDEPYPLMPISGFVDKNRTSWEIEYLKEASC